MEIKKLEEVKEIATEKSKLNIGAICESINSGKMCLETSEAIKKAYDLSSAIYTPAEMPTLKVVKANYKLDLEV